MEESSVKLTVFFEAPFWVGIFERTEGQGLQVAKVTFGQEPKDGEVLACLLEGYHRISYSPAVAMELKPMAANPKRRQRQAAKQMQSTGLGTKSQQALAAQREEMKVQRRQVSREQREAEKQRQFDLKQ